MCAHHSAFAVVCETIVGKAACWPLSFKSRRHDIPGFFTPHQVDNPAKSVTTATTMKKQGKKDKGRHN